MEDETQLKTDKPTRKNWRSFYSLLLMQTQNAFNDKAVQFLLICTAGALAVQVPPVETFFTQKMQYLLGGLIVTPFILFAPLAGWIGDRFAKSAIIQFSSLFQVCVFFLIAFAMLQKNLALLVLCFFLLAIQSAILSPAKVGIIKELVGKQRLGFASGLLEMFTILGILAGTIIMSHWYGARLAQPLSAWEALKFPIYVLLAFTPIAILGAFLIERTKPKGGKKFHPSLLIEHFQQVNALLRRRELRLSALAVTYFWIFGGFIQLLSVQIAKEGSGEAAVGLGPDLANMMLVAGGGVALGSVLASLVSKRRIELGLVPIGGAVMALSCFFMAFCQPLSFSFMLWMLFSGVGAAIFLVPVNAFLQDSCEESERGRVLAANNLLNCLGGILAVAAQGVMNEYFKMTPATQLIILGIISILATAYATRLLPKDIVRFVALMCVRVIYRIRIKNDYNMPKEGGVLLTPNHITYLDAFILSAASPREVRFLIFDAFYEKKWMGGFLRLFNTVPISKAKAKDAIKVAAKALEQGDVVCIFPEGQLTRTGTVNEIQRGFEMIARKAKCPVQPVYMDGLWGSIFSFERNRFLKKKPYSLPYGVTISFGKPLPWQQASQDLLRNKLLELGSEALSLRKSMNKVEALARRNPRLLAGNMAHLHAAQASYAAMTENEQKKLTYNALQLSNNAALVRGQLLIVDVDLVEKAAPLLLHTLPLVNRHPLLLLDAKTASARLESLALKYPDALWLLSEALASKCADLSLNASVYLIEECKNNAEKKDRAHYTWWLHRGFILALNMPDQEAEENSDQLLQRGTKENSLGRLLAGFYHTEKGIKTALQDSEIILENTRFDRSGFAFKDED